MSKVLFDDGKYKILWDNGKMSALRFEEQWRDLTGDNLILSLCNRIEELEGKVGSQMASEEEIAVKIMDSKIVIFAKKVGRKLAELMKAEYDDPEDKYLKDKSKELAKALVGKISSPDTECPVCKGSGWKSEIAHQHGGNECTTCDGTGKASVRRVEDEDDKLRAERDAFQVDAAHKEMDAFCEHKNAVYQKAQCLKLESENKALREALKANGCDDNGNPIILGLK